MKEVTLEFNCQIYYGSIFDKLPDEIFEVPIITQERNKSKLLIGENSGE